jgi:excisionase family DNA binding protein
METATRRRELVSIPEAARETTISRETLYRKLATGELEGVKVGRSVRLYRDSLERWLTDHTKK